MTDAGDTRTGGGGVLRAQATTSIEEAFCLRHARSLELKTKDVGVQNLGVSPSPSPSTPSVSRFGAPCDSFLNGTDVSSTAQDLGDRLCQALVTPKTRSRLPFLAFRKTERGTAMRQCKRIGVVSPIETYRNKNNRVAAPRTHRGRKYAWCGQGFTVPLGSSWNGCSVVLRFLSIGKKFSLRMEIVRFCFVKIPQS